MRLGFRICAMTAVAAMSVTLGACGSSSSSSSSSSTTAASAGSSSSSGLSAATQQAVDAAYKGTFSEPSTSGPKPQPGKNIWVIQQSAQVTDLSAPGQILDAAKLMGWHVKLLDGKGDPSTWVTLIRQAIAAKADGIILYVIDCAPVKAALQDAKKAGIPVVGWETIDCDQTISKTGVVEETGQPRLFDATITYPDPGDPSQQVGYAQSIGVNWPDFQARSVAAGSKGKGKVITFTETDIPITVALGHGFEQGLKKWCPGCQIVDNVQFTYADYGQKLQDMATQALDQHPEATVVNAAFDSVTPYIAPAVVASGRKDKLFVQGGEGTAAIATRVRDNNGVNAGVGYSVDWEGWAAMDAMNRLLNGQKPSGAGFPSGLGFQIYDKTHNLPPAGQSYQPPIDFRAAYKKAWGAG